LVVYKWLLSLDLCLEGLNDYLDVFFLKIISKVIKSWFLRLSLVTLYSLSIQILTSNEILMSSVEHCSKTWTGPAVEPFLLLVPAFFNSVFDCCFSQSSLFCFLTYVLFHLLSATLAIVFFNFYDCDDQFLWLRRILPKHLSVRCLHLFSSYSFFSFGLPLLCIFGGLGLMHSVLKIF